MAHRIERSDYELFVAFELAVVAGCLSWVVPVYRDIFISFGTVLPLVTRLVLAGRIIYLILFLCATAALVLLTLEGLGRDGGRVDRWRHQVQSTLERMAGSRAAQLQALLVGGAILTTTLLMVCAVYGLFCPMVVMGDPAGTQPARSTEASVKR